MLLTKDISTKSQKIVVLDIHVFKLDTIQFLSDRFFLVQVYSNPDLFSSGYFG